jgi:hypothetical protein
VGRCHHSTACRRVAEGETASNMEETADKGRSSSLGVGRGANNSSPKKLRCYSTFLKESKLDWSFCTGQALGSGQEQVAGSCACGNEPSGSIKCGEFLDLAEDLLGFQDGLCSMEPVSQLVKYLLLPTELTCLVYTQPTVTSTTLR